MKLLNFLQKWANVFASASGNNPAVATLTVILFYLPFNSAEAMIETLLFGERFEHWLDPFFVIAFILFAAMTVEECATNRALEAMAQGGDA